MEVRALIVLLCGGLVLQPESLSAEINFYHYDGQISTRQLTDESAEITDDYTYDAFGVPPASTGTTPDIYPYNDIAPSTLSRDPCACTGCNEASFGVQVHTGSL